MGGVCFLEYSRHAALFPALPLRLVFPRACCRTVAERSASCGKSAGPLYMPHVRLRKISDFPPADGCDVPLAARAAFAL